MSVQHDLEKNLAIFSYQKEDESFYGWLERVAYLNCLKRDELFNLITYNENTAIVSFYNKETLEKPLSWSASSIISSYYHTLFSARFCPKCFDELKEPYYKQEWDYPWLIHCTKHGVPLISRCKQCHIQSIQNVASWKASWMACDNCIESNHSISDPNKHIKLISPIVLKVIALLEITPMTQKNITILSTLFSIAECVSEDFTHYSFGNYYFLRSQGVEPLDYLTSKVITLNRYNKPVDGLSFDQALACAWDIPYKSPHIIAEMARHHSAYGTDITNILNDSLSSPHFQ